jgi:hypothetical protein
MADITAPRALLFESAPRRIRGVAAASTAYIRGQILVVNASGQLVIPTDAAGRYAKGIFNGEVEGKGKHETYSTAAGENPSLGCDTGPVWLPLAGVTQANDHAFAYLGDSGGLTLTAGAKTVRYQIKDVDIPNGLALVDLDRGWV